MPTQHSVEIIMHSNVYRLPQPRFDTARFNQAARAFFENWRPRSTSRGAMPVPKILVRFDFSTNGYLVAHYADPVSRRIEIWGLDVQSFLGGKLVARPLKA